jgi:putative ABC transport system ATP-binding protein
MERILFIDKILKNLPGETVSIFSNITISIKEPEIINIIGESGQGKSTLLRILGLLEMPDSGDVYLFDKSIKHWGPIEWRKKVGYVTQFATMLSGTVEDNLRIVNQLHHIPFDKKYVIDLLESIGLGNVEWNKPANLLSGGEKQRLALVRTLLMKPEILLLDEVTASLDIHSRLKVEKLLKSCHGEKEMTIIWVTHDIKQAQRLGSRIWLLRGGKLIEESPSYFTNLEKDTHSLLVGSK